MIITTQNGRAMVNLAMLTSICVNPLKPQVLAWYGAGDEDYTVLGEYATDERAIEVLEEIVSKYGMHKYTDGGAFATYDGYQPAFGFVPPKVYRMPKE